MPALVPCPECGQLVSARACSCGSCGTKVKDCSPSLRAVVGAAALGLGLAACDGPFVGEPEYGVVDTGFNQEDFDNDGFSEPEDCDDEDPAVNPDAEETPGDGIDSNCNDDDDT